MMLISREYDNNYESVDHNIVPKGAIFSLQRENEPNFKVRMQHGWFLWSNIWFGPKLIYLIINVFRARKMRHSLKIECFSRGWNTIQI
jgi:hypothetical protein